MKSIRLDSPGLALIFIVPMVLLAMVNIYIKVQGKESNILLFSFVLTVIAFAIYSIFLYLHIRRLPRRYDER